MDPTKKELYTAKRSSGLSTEDPAIHAALGELLDAQEDAWVLTSLSGSQLLLAGKGQSLQELVDLVRDDDVYFGYIKVFKDNRPKTFGFAYFGENAPGMKRGKASLYKPAALGLAPIHAELQCNVPKSSFTCDYLQGEIKKVL